VSAHGDIGVNVNTVYMFVMEVICMEFRIGLPSQLLYADDLVLLDDSGTELMQTLNRCKDEKLQFVRWGILI